MIKVRYLVLLIFLIGNEPGLYAKSVKSVDISSNEKINKINAVDYFKKITPEFLYSYTDFNFNSNSGENFNKYNGHSNLYSAGVDHLSLTNTMLMGIYYFGIDTVVKSQWFINPGFVTDSSQSLHNNTLFVHILKNVTPNFFTDVAGGYGYNKVSTITQINISSEPLIGQANNNNNNWFASIDAIYRTTWKKFLVRTDMGVLYSEIDSPRYNYFFPALNKFQTIQPLVNKATLILENAELGYFINSKLMPFISGGLIQVAAFSNNRPLVNPVNEINGSLPQLNMNKNGFRVSGGLVYVYKNVSLRIEEKYYNASKTFHSNQTLAALTYQLD